MPMHLPSGLYMQAVLASYSFGREALCVAFIIGDLFCAISSFRWTRSTIMIQTSYCYVGVMSTCGLVGCILKQAFDLISLPCVDFHLL